MHAILTHWMWFSGNNSIQCLCSFFAAYTYNSKFTFENNSVNDVQLEISPGIWNKKDWNINTEKKTHL